MRGQGALGAFLSPHELDKLLANSKAKSDAKRILDALVTDLGEEPKKALHVFLADANSRVLDRNMQAQVAGKFGL